MMLKTASATAVAPTTSAIGMAAFVRNPLRPRMDG
jgi:hypothetical protein